MPCGTDKVSGRCDGLDWIRISHWCSERVTRCELNVLVNRGGTLDDK